MIITFSNKGNLIEEFNIPAKDVTEALRWIDRNVPVTLDADHLEIKQPSLIDMTHLTMDRR